MKRFVKLLTLVLAVTIIAAVSSCTKEEIDNNTPNNNTNNGNAPRGYTMGYYHPEKKIKKISFSQFSKYYNTNSHNGDSTDFKVMAEFIWDGDNLKTITDGQRSGECVYDSLGYISSWTLNNSNKVYSYSYNTGVNANGCITEYLGAVSISNMGTVWNFDNNGILVGLGITYFDTVTMANGNAVEVGTDYYGHFSYSYDNKKNPFKDLLVPPGYYNYVSFPEIDIIDFVTDNFWFQDDNSDYYDYGWMMHRVSKNNFIPKNQSYERWGSTIRTTFNVEYNTGGWPIKLVGRQLDIEDGMVETEVINTIVIEYYE